MDKHLSITAPIVIIDALDECDDSGRRMNTLSNTHQSHALQVMVTGRDERILGSSQSSCSLETQLYTQDRGNLEFLTRPMPPDNGLVRVLDGDLQATGINDNRYYSQLIELSNHEHALDGSDAIILILTTSPLHAGDFVRLILPPPKSLLDKVPPLVPGHKFVHGSRKYTEAVHKASHRISTTLLKEEPEFNFWDLLKQFARKVQCPLLYLHGYWKKHLRVLTGKRTAPANDAKHTWDAEMKAGLTECRANDIRQSLDVLLIHGSLIVSGSHLWVAETGALTDIKTAAFSPDGKGVISSASDRDYSTSWFCEESNKHCILSCIVSSDYAPFVGATIVQDPLSSTIISPDGTSGSNDKSVYDPPTSVKPHKKSVLDPVMSRSVISCE